MANKTALQQFIEWGDEMLKSNPPKVLSFAEAIDKAEKLLEVEKEQMIGFAEYVAGYPDKNRNYLGQMLHARSKYDEANRTVDLLEQYYKETYNK